MKEWDPTNRKQLFLENCLKAINDKDIAPLLRMESIEAQAEMVAAYLTHANGFAVEVKASDMAVIKTLRGWSGHAPRSSQSQHQGLQGRQTGSAHEHDRLGCLDGWCTERPSDPDH